MKKKKRKLTINEIQPKIIFYFVIVMFFEEKKKKTITSSENSFCLEPTTVYYRHENQIEY